MTLAISLLTISTVSFLIATFMHSFAYGFFWSTLLHVVYYMIFGSGFLLPTSQVFVNYFWSAFLFSVAGYVLAIMLNIPALLNGAYYTQVFDKDFKKSRVQVAVRSGDKLKTFGKFLVTILIIAVGHIVYELNVSGFPKWAGGIILIALIPVAWFLAFYLLFRTEDNKRTALFNSNNPNGEVLSIAFHMTISQAIYALAYIIFQAIDCPNWDEKAPTVTDGECGIFIDGQWYFYSSLIAGGVILVYAIVVGIASRGYTTKEEMDSRAEYSPLKQNLA
jgi:hypothetical protein